MFVCFLTWLKWLQTVNSGICHKEFLPLCVSTHDSGRREMLQIPKNFFVRTEGFSCELTKCPLLPLFNQCVPGSVFIFCRAEPPVESLPATKRLDSMVCTEKLTTAEHDGGGLRLIPSLFCTRKKRRDFFWKGKRFFWISQKYRIIWAFNDKEKSVFVLMIWEYDSFGQSEWLWLLFLL